MDRKTFLKSLVVLGAAVPCGRFAAAKNDGACEDSKCMSDAGAVRQFLSDFLRNEEKNLDRATLVKLMQQRGRACCRNLKFRQDLIAQSAGNVVGTQATWWQGKYSLDQYHERLKQVAQARVAVIQDAGHMLHHDQPEQLATLIEGFLEQ